MKIIKLKTVNSTNTWALSHFKELDDLSVITADVQTKGKGRFDRIWVSECSENIYLSFVLKPQKKDCITNLTQYLSVAVSKILEEYSVKPEIKWPNDVLVNGRKICGILCESYMCKNKIEGVVLGVGINLNMTEQSLKNIPKPATALNIETGHKIEKEDFLNKLLSEFFSNYTNAIDNGFASFKDEYLKRACFPGKTIFLQQRDGAEKEELFAKSVDDSGNLIVVTKDNKEKIILSGDIFYN